MKYRTILISIFVMGTVLAYGVGEQLGKQSVSIAVNQDNRAPAAVSGMVVDTASGAYGALFYRMKDSINRITCYSFISSGLTNAQVVCLK